MIDRRQIITAGIGIPTAAYGGRMQALWQFLRSLTLPTGATSGARVVIDGTGDAILLYDASNRLVASIAATAGTDAAGNAYPAGFASLSGNSPSIISNLFQGIDWQGFSTDPTQQIDYAHAASFACNGPGFAELDAGFRAGNGGIQILFNDGATSGGPNNASPTMQVQASAGGSVFMPVLGAVVGGDPVNGEAKWQDASSILGTGWAIGSNASGSYQPAVYRLTNENEVWIVGAAHCTTATPSTTILNMPAGFRPVKASTGATPDICPLGPIIKTASADGSLAIGRANVQDTGPVVLGGFTFASGDNIYFNHRYPLGVIP